MHVQTSRTFALDLKLNKTNVWHRSDWNQDIQSFIPISCICEHCYTVLLTIYQQYGYCYTVPARTAVDGLCRFGGAVSLAHKPQTSVQEDLSAQQLRSHLHDTGQGPGGWRPEQTVKTVKLEGVTVTRCTLTSSQIPRLASKLTLSCHFH